jgi:hypothetical protein
VLFTIRVAGLIRVCAAVLILIALPAIVSAQSIAPISANDNRQSAGTLTSNVLTLNLLAERGEWQPEGPNGQMLSVYAFREERGSLLIPGPLIRVRTGTEIHVSIRNAIRKTTFGSGVSLVARSVALPWNVRPTVRRYGRLAGAGFFSAQIAPALETCSGNPLTALGNQNSLLKAISSFPPVCRLTGCESSSQHHKTT